MTKVEVSKFVLRNKILVLGRNKNKKQSWLTVFDRVLTDSMLTKWTTYIKCLENIMKHFSYVWWKSFKLFFKVVSTLFVEPQLLFSLLQLLSYIRIKGKQRIKQNRKIGTPIDEIFIPCFVIIINLRQDSCKVINMI